MKISFLNFDVPNNRKRIDYFWLSLKSYIEDNNIYSDKLEWVIPLSHSNFPSIEECVDTILVDNPDILLCSLYVWNHVLQFNILKLVKERNPNITIIVGGPNATHIDPNFFNEHYYIDFSSQIDGYGEVFFDEFINQYFTDKDWTKVPYLVMPGFKSSVKFKKNLFKWPKNIYGRNKPYLNLLFMHATKNNLDLGVALEFSRGCPYGCTFCEWGGGTASKMAFKPLDYIIEDLDILKNYSLQWVVITDSNFGIIPRDIEITKKIIQCNKNTIENLIITGPSKTNKHILHEIEELFMKSSIGFEVKISLQDLSEDVKKNINRIDEPWLDQLNTYKRIAFENNTSIKLELMIGLPGASLTTFYDSLNIILPRALQTTRFLWLFLPTTPAAQPAYVKLHSIESIPVKNINAPKKNIISSLLGKDEYMETSPVVVRTSSYTRDEFVEMYIMGEFITTFEEMGYIAPVTRGLFNSGVPYNVFYKKLWDTFLNGKLISGEIGDNIRTIIQRTKAGVHSNEELIIDQTITIDGKIKEYTTPSEALEMIINNNTKTFYNIFYVWCYRQGYRNINTAYDSFRINPSYGD